MVGSYCERAAIYLLPTFSLTIVGVRRYSEQRDKEKHLAILKRRKASNPKTNACLYVNHHIPLVPPKPKK